jgi:hypothetical protein
MSQESVWLGIGSHDGWCSWCLVLVLWVRVLVLWVLVGR